MNELKVGDWVVHQDLVDYRCFDVPCSTPIDIYRIENVDGFYIWVRGIRKDYDLFRKATVLDYIRTLDAEQLAKVINTCSDKCYYRGYCNVCNFNDKDTVIRWLNQLLTDEIVKRIGGK